MKTPEELNALKEEVIALNKQLAELTEDELKQVNGGIKPVAVYIADTVALEVCKHTSCIGRDCEQFEQ